MVPLSTADILYKPGHAGSTGILPNGFQLAQNYPNPFNPSTTIEFTLSRNAAVSLEIYNALGQRVRTLVDGPTKAGQHAVEWDGTDDAKAHLSSGVYFYRLTIDGASDVRKMVLVK